VTRSAPLVSIVIPSYNHERFVGEAIDSVVRQSYRPIELVVVDDGSRDRSREVIAAQLSQAPLQAARLIEQPNAGAHAALTRGIDASAGALVGILNSDDVYHPERVAMLVRSVGDGDPALAFSRVELVDAAGRPLPPEDAWCRWYPSALEGIRSSPTIGFALLLANLSVSSSNLFFTRSVWDAVRPFGPYRFCHDWDFLMRSVLVTEPTLVDEPLLRYRIHETNSTASLRDVQEAEVSDALNRFLAAALAAPSPNTLAPTPGNWPHLLPLFVAGRKFHFGTSEIAHYVRPELRERVLHPPGDRADPSHA
jgi:glycosyltransferase involved in cell wall biosynthesis